MSPLATVTRGLVLLTLLSAGDSGTSSARTFRSSANNGSAKHQRITIRVRNGKTGFPIWLASPIVYVGKVDVQHMDEARRKTVLWNDAHINVQGADPRRVTVVVELVDRDCRDAASDGSLSATSEFDLDLVLSKGVVAPNLCSSKTQKPEPGVITLYVLPETIKELWNR
ncbi:hypothetical protein HDF16_006273 [Granulicella aggregans]|uniref:Uncharacterized protein n=1 Tax=Granulicella aggregans TaxID=474949 RepID=A0A7W7ZKG6_9BACT|nr:hypothetical protein [Granulicella aggregans]MBB5061537.1 hypothetical protein [Granulicella aggregans]